MLPKIETMKCIAEKLLYMEFQNESYLIFQNYKQGAISRVTFLKEHSGIEARKIILIFRLFSSSMNRICN